MPSGRITVRLPADVLIAIAARARKEGLSKSYVLLRLLRSGLRAEEKTLPGTKK